MTLYLHGDVDICAFKQPFCFVEKLFLNNQIGLACIQMVAKTLSLCEEGVPPCSQLKAGGCTGSIVCIQQGHILPWRGGPPGLCLQWKISHHLFVSYSGLVRDRY